MEIPTMASAIGLISYRLKDSDGVYFNKEEFVVFDDTKTMANIATYAGLYAAVLDAVTGCEIVQQTFRIIIPTAGLKSAPVADTDGEETMLMHYIQTGTFSTWGDDVPGLIDAGEVGGRLDLTNAAVAAYNTFQTAAHTGFTPSSRYGFATVAVQSGE